MFQCPRYLICITLAFWFIPQTVEMKLLKQMMCTPDKTVFFLNSYLKALTYSAVFVYPTEDLVQKNISTKLELLLKILHCEPVLSLCLFYHTINLTRYYFSSEEILERILVLT